MSPHFDTLIHHTDLNLPLRSQSAFLEFKQEGVLVDRFEKPRPQPTMHLNRRPNNLPRKILFHSFCISFWFSGFLLEWFFCFVFPYSHWNVCLLPGFCLAEQLNGWFIVLV